MSNEINALSIIDTVEIDNIANTMAKIQQKGMILEKYQEQVNQHY